MQIQSQVTQRLELSLKALTLSSKEALGSSPRTVVSPRTSRNIGTESCTVDRDLIEKDDEAKGKAMSSMRKERVQKEFPPLMPMLARTQNLHSHMPWKLKRYYTPDGRLILREERVRHHEYFRAHRANGRLTLHLVHLHHHDVFHNDDNRSVGDHHQVHLENDKAVGPSAKCLKNSSIQYAFFGLPLASN